MCEREYFGVQILRSQHYRYVPHLKKLLIVTEFASQKRLTVTFFLDLMELRTKETTLWFQPKRSEKI